MLHPKDLQRTILSIQIQVFAEARRPFDIYTTVSSYFDDGEVIREDEIEHLLVEWRKQLWFTELLAHELLQRCRIIPCDELLGRDVSVSNGQYEPESYGQLDFAVQLVHAV